MMPERRISISTSSLLLLVGAGLLLVILWQLRNLLVILMIAVVISSTLAPLVKSVERRGISSWLAVILVYLGLLSLITGISLILGPTIIAQIQQLFDKLPGYLDILQTEFQNLVTRRGFTHPEVLDFINQLLDIQSLVSWTLSYSQKFLIGVSGVTRGILGGVLNVILAVLFSAYMLSGSKKLIKDIVNLFPYPWDERLEAQIIPISQRMGGYIQGRLLVSSILGLAISLGLRFLGISEFALGLGTIAGITNLIPFFGPVLGSIPALIVAIAQGGWMFLWVLLLFLFIQNVETYVLDPLLVGSSVNVSPLYQLLAVLSGVQILGILGALIVPPWVAGAGVLLQNLYLIPKLQAQGQAISLSEHE
ncbi:AI-2E family transporter [Cyanobacterium sp. uoEpiScrs1]|uniref:AI-2E family transporter n=1 Tax=Cyanobacterium sp. uoEpiScrs1 TaxID=2976343 RepID=UPI00226A3958|nr:AI-2E family transporter [Cyanobacterium sp. uoEpiScrs1]